MNYSEKVQIFQKYNDQLANIYRTYSGNTNISKYIKNAEKRFAHNVDTHSIIGFIDHTVLNNGKNGYLFTEDKIYAKEMLEKPQKIWYDEIKNLQLNANSSDDQKGSILFEMLDGETYEWTEEGINKTPTYHLIKELIEADKVTSENINPVFHKVNPDSNISVGAYDTIRTETIRSYHEEKFHAKQGHGYAAERANDLYDKMTGHETVISGDNNAPNGADRIVDGIKIQSKYCRTGSDCIKECFDDNGNFRYMSGKHPMKIEVPSDKYDDAVSAMKSRIQKGEVPGIDSSDTSKAEEIVKKGHFTYKQARNIAKAGTVESLTYDAVNGAITASSAFGVSASITLAISVWNGENFETALKYATYTGLKIGGASFLTAVLAGQLSKAGLNSVLVNSSEKLMQILGPKASSFLINAFRSDVNIYGAAAVKSSAKLLRGNIISSVVMTVVLSSFDFVSIFKGKISRGQLFKNIFNNASGVTGGAAGGLAGAAVGSAILPVAGTLIGGVVGAIAGGSGAEKVTNSITSQFLEDDANVMMDIIQKRFSELSTEYLLNSEEAEKIADHLQEKINGNFLKSMYASENRISFIDDVLESLMVQQTRKRSYIPVPNDNEMTQAVRETLEELQEG